MTEVRAMEERAAEAGRRGVAPFLVWPVSRRDFYMSIGVAMLPALAWGMLVFGWRIVGMVVLPVAVTMGVHWLLKRFTERGKRTVYAHSIVATLVMVGLYEPFWHGRMALAAAALIPLVLWMLGGPGHERVHVAVAVVVILQFLVVPWVGGQASTSEGILARDRLVMGDIRNQRKPSVSGWPKSVMNGGFDALRMENPGRGAMGLWDELSGILRRSGLKGDGGRALGQADYKEARGDLDAGLGKRLPSVEMLMIGAVPARVATGSLLAILIGGLYLAYRFILRPRSVGIFFGSFVAGLALLAIWPGALGKSGVGGVWAMWSAFPGEMGTLLSYAVFNSDVMFAAVFVLALPGTEPLTGRGRRVFLVMAGLLGAFLARMNWGLPAASVGLCVLMPFAGWFDAWFGKRSWMNRFGI